MTEKIEQKITGYKVKTEEVSASQPTIPSYHESYERPDVIQGKTYKIKPADTAFYVTINDALINDKWRPFELFVSTKDVQHFMWVMIFSRLVSAILRKGGEYEFMIDEMKAIIDPATGGYWKKGGGGHVPSLVADIGNVLG